jgi:molybdopterin converting factor small subunit
MATLVPHYGLATALGEKRVTTSAATVKEMLEEVARRVPPSVREEMGKAAILVNGRNINYLAGTGTPLAPDDVVWMVVPSAGG